MLIRGMEPCGSWVYGVRDQRVGGSYDGGVALQT